MLTPIKCENCGRVLGKMDEDGTLHVRLEKEGPQIFVSLKNLNENSNLMLICPSKVYTQTGKIRCGYRHIIDPEILKQAPIERTRETACLIA